MTCKDNEYQRHKVNGQGCISRPSRKNTYI